MIPSLLHTLYFLSRRTGGEVLSLLHVGFSCIPSEAHLRRACFKIYTKKLIKVSILGIAQFSLMKYLTLLLKGAPQAFSSVFLARRRTAKPNSHLSEERMLDDKEIWRPQQHIL
mmetsp:Transcript_16336/g.23725  ORF Transcript_16336/g.23725 Transcript_16336/m.23725 type:complete len:114 (-) Transcript_16336:6557-6898(-)